SITVILGAEGAITNRWNLVATFTSPPGGQLWLQSTWADFDHDGRLDILLAARSYTQLRQNTGDYTNWPTLTSTTQFPFLAGCIWAAWNDIDKDGYPEVLIADGSNLKLFKNNQGSFSLLSGLSFASGAGGRVEWADVDGDGWKDFLHSYLVS